MIGPFEITAWLILLIVILALFWPEINDEIKNGKVKRESERVTDRDRTTKLTERE